MSESNTNFLNQCDDLIAENTALLIELCASEYPARQFPLTGFILLSVLAAMNDEQLSYAIELDGVALDIIAVDELNGVIKLCAVKGQELKP